MKANQVNPKFHRGDWITNGRYNKLIVGINSDWPYYMFKDGTSKRIKDIDEKYHLWSIKDARNGDVLVSQYSQPFIYNGHYNEYKVGSHCGIECSGEQFIDTYSETCWTDNKSIKPATKEQRDLLIAKMKEASYAFDFEKKELKKIGQKTTWSEEDKKLLLKVLFGILPYGVKGVITYDESNTTFTVEGIDNNVLHLSDAEECYVEDFKPYLRSMSSMTEEEDKEWQYYKNAIAKSCDERLEDRISELHDWLNAHHFDYRGLIPKGLALAVTENNNPYKNK